MSVLSSVDQGNFTPRSLKSLSADDVAKLATLSLVSKALNSSNDIEAVLRSMLDNIMTALGVDRGFIKLDNPEVGLDYDISIDRSVKPWGTRFLFTGTLLEDCLEERKPVLILDTGNIESTTESMVISGIRSVMLHPIILGDQLLGVLYLDCLLHAGRFEENDLKLLGVICEMTAVNLDRALQTARVAEAQDQLKSAAEETIYKLSRAAEHRDNESGEHLMRVGLYCEAIARKLGLDEATVTALKVASQLHDVGKVGIPDAILLKPGRFTDYEREVMKQHTVIGASILSNSNNPVIQLAEVIAHRHHEKWDGSGYPDGISGDEIPLPAQIVAVADVFDAVSSKRRYKASYSLDDSFDLISREAGSHFAPQVAGAFLAIRELAERIFVENQAEEVVEPSTEPESVLQEAFGDTGEMLSKLRGAVVELARDSKLSDPTREQSLLAIQGLEKRLRSTGRLGGLQILERLIGYLTDDEISFESAPRMAELLAAVAKVLLEEREEPTTATVMVLDPDPYQREALSAEATRRGITVVESESPATARATIQLKKPDLVVIEVAQPGGEELVEWLCEEKPELPLVVLSKEGSFSLRLSVAQKTGAVFLHKPLPPSAVFDEIEENLGGRKTETTHRILALDDDRLILKMISRLLEKRGFEVRTIDDPLLLWEALAECQPDLLILDLEMPTVNGFDICRVLRGDPKHRHLPILVLTSHQDVDNYQRALEAGADDLLHKPLQPNRMVSRINSRLARNQALTRSTARDPVTGFLHKREAVRSGDQLFALAMRGNLPFSICWLEVEGLAEQPPKVANQLLRKVAHLLEHANRTEDIVARDGPHRLLLMLHGVDKKGAQQRVTSLNTRLSQLDDGSPPVRCKAEIVSYPEDGTSFKALLEMN